MTAAESVRTTKLISVAASTATLFVAIAVACYAPARRAASVDPARTLSEQ